MAADRAERPIGELRVEAYRAQRERCDLKGGVFWFVVYRKTARRHVASCEMDSGHWALRPLSLPGFQTIVSSSHAINTLSQSPLAVAPLADFL